MATHEFSTKDIQKESSERYGSLVVSDAPGGAVTYRSVLRLEKQAREEITQIMTGLEQFGENPSVDEIDTLEQGMARVLGLVADDEARSTALLDTLDNADLHTLFELWAKKTQPGEA